MAKKKQTRKKKAEVQLKLSVVGPPEPTCCRSGNCCRVILLGTSPYQLWEEFRRARDGLLSDRPERIRDAVMYYLMLTGRCRGKWQHPDSKAIRYVYGPCHFLHDVTGEQAACKIHHVRPDMCSRYPYYREGRQLESAATGAGPNPGYMRGCGYNVNPQDGFTLSDFEKLLPLESAEMEPHLQHNMVDASP